MKYKINLNSTVPLYKQVINQILGGIKSGNLQNGDPLPSLNKFASSTGISMETVKKAYYILKGDGVLSGRHGKGFYVDVREKNSPKRILMLLDKLSAYKLDIHKGFMECIGNSCQVTINIHNQDIGLFEKLVEDSAEAYDYYLVAAHFPCDDKKSNILKILHRIPNDKLILLDYELPEAKGHIGRVYQDFRHDAAQTLEGELDLIRKYDNLIIISSEKSLYGGIIAPEIKKMFLSHGIKCSVTDKFNTSMMTPGALFIVLCGQLDNDHFTILREVSARGYTLGKEIGLISYNDEPVNEFICGGLTCISSDFKQMGRSAAEMILSKKLSSVHNKFTIIKRSSL